MERIDYTKSLVAMYQSPPSAASMDNPLCDVVHTKSGPRPVFPSKISVGSELAKLCNWHKETTKLEAVRAFFRSLTKCSGVKIHQYDLGTSRHFGTRFGESRISTRSEFVMAA
jgi:hypothetical protein